MSSHCHAVHYSTTLRRFQLHCQQRDLASCDLLVSTIFGSWFPRVNSSNTQDWKGASLYLSAPGAGLWTCPLKGKLTASLITMLPSTTILHCDSGSQGKFSMIIYIIFIDMCLRIPLNTNRSLHSQLSWACLCINVLHTQAVLEGLTCNWTTVLRSLQPAHVDPQASLSWPKLLSISSIIYSCYFPLAIDLWDALLSQGTNGQPWELECSTSLDRTM